LEAPPTYAEAHLVLASVQSMRLQARGTIMVVWLAMQLSKAQESWLNRAVSEHLAKVG